MRADRPYDLVLLGATGFTGALTARYLATHAPEGCRWALAGRDRAKLERLRAYLAGLNPACASLPLLAADTTDPASLRALAESTKVVATTVGPYALHGAALVAACAEAGTDYADLCGEPEFIDRMYVEHHARAVETGARIVHACGFDSIPYDLGVLYTVRRLPQGVPVRVDGFVRAAASVSGGTFASAITAFSRARHLREAAKARRVLEKRPAGRRVSSSGAKLHRERDLRFWAVPLPTVDAQIVARSAAALDDYGPDFRYRHFAAVRRLPVALGGMATVALTVLAAQIGPVRRALLSRRRPGDGPSPEKRAKSWFTATFRGQAGGETITTRVSGGDPGYDETARMLGESALCLAFDDLPKTSGQVTTAVAMGDVLIDRLIASGLRFEVR